MFWTSESKLGVFLPMIMRLLLTVTDQWNSQRSIRGVLEPPLGCSTIGRYNFKKNEILAFKENEKKKKIKSITFYFKGYIC